MSKRKIAWITGGASGIGFAGARALGEIGYHVVLTSRTEASLHEACASLQREGVSATYAVCDVTDEASVKRAAAQILADHSCIDVLVNSAGLNVAQRLWGDVDGADFDKVIAGNLNGSFYCIAALLPSMRARKSGLIINIASWAGKFVSVGAGPAYAAAKHAVVAMTHSLNMSEFRNGVRACAISPGEVATPIMLKRAQPPSAEELGRMLQPDDLGRTIRFVAEMPEHACINEIVLSPTFNRGL